MTGRAENATQARLEGSVSLLKRLAESPVSLRREANRDGYWDSVMKGVFGEVEKVYQLQYCAAITELNKVRVLIAYFRDFPESATHSNWTEAKVLELWRRGDADSLGALGQIVRCREKPRPFRARMKQALQSARLALFDEAYPDLKKQYGEIKLRIRTERGERPGIKRAELWDRLVSAVPGEHRPLIDRDHFFQLASTIPRDRHCTPAYVARSYLRQLLRLPDRTVSRPHSQSSLRGMRIQLYDEPPTVTD
jgi:hypothetical protein